MSHAYLRRCLFLLGCLINAEISEAKTGVRVREAADVGDLFAELRRAQYSAPPVHDGKMISHDIGNVIFDPARKDWPAALVGNLVSEQAGDGSVSWPFSLYEEASTHSALLLNGDGKVIHVFAAETGYDAEWVFHRRFSQRRAEALSRHADRYAALLSPSRIMLKGRFVLPDHKSVVDEKKYASGRSMDLQSQVLPLVLATRDAASESFFSEYSAMGASVPFSDPNGISGDTPGFPPQGYKDYLYVQIGHEPPYLLDTLKNVREVVYSSPCALFVYDNGAVSGLGYDPLVFDPNSDPLDEIPVVKWFDLSSGVSNVVSATWDGCGYFMFLHGDGKVSGWGKTNNACGMDDVPACVTNAVAVAAAMGQASAVLGDGRVVAWGDFFGDQVYIPTNIVNAQKVVSSWNQTLVLLGDGRVVDLAVRFWGETNVADTVTNAVAVAAGFSHSLALLADGRVIAWGDNGYGQTDVPSEVTNAVAVAAGWDHSVALLNDGTVVAWGDDGYGQATVPDYLTGALGIGAVEAQSGALLSDGSAAVWGGWHEDGCPETPLNILGPALACRVLQTSFSTFCEPGVLTAIVRAPAGGLDGSPESDADGDGLSLFDETCRFGTDPTLKDTDNDGLDDGAETVVPFLTLWDPLDPAGSVFSGCNAVQVTATATARAARLADGRVIVFTGSNINLAAHTNICSAVEIDATDTWVAARLADGNVRVWREVSGGLSATNLVFTNAVDISCGFQHLLVLHANGKVTCVKAGTNGDPAVYAPGSSVCVGVTNAVKISAGSKADAILLSNGSFRFGDALTTSYTVKTFAGTPAPVPVDVASGTNKAYVVLFSNGSATAYKQTTSGEYDISSGVVAIAAGGDAQFLAVLSDERNAVFISNEMWNSYYWDYTTVSNRLLDAKDLWWRRNSRMAVDAAGDLNAMRNAVASGRRLDFFASAVTPGGLARGIALACSGTSPTNSDSDADGIPDGWEVLHWFNPMDASDRDSDADGDGLSNLREYQCGTDPRLRDTDGDGYEDGWEADNGFDPTDPADTGADPDGDGLTNVEEYLQGTDPALYDMDGDGLGDGAETTVPFLTLWDSAGDTGQVFTACMVAQVTASDTARAALLTDGRVIVFTGSGSGLKAYTNDCGAVEVDATESWIAARTAAGRVSVWPATTNSVGFADAGLTNVVGISCGYRHLLALHGGGSVTCLTNAPSGSAAVRTNNFCKACTNAISVSAGVWADAAVFTNGNVLLGNVFATTQPVQKSPAFGWPAVVAAGSNLNFVVHMTNGHADAYYGTSYTRADGPTETLFVAAGGSSNMVAVLANGSNAVFTTGKTTWSYTAVTARLQGARDLWWKRDCRLAVTNGGFLLPLSAASASGRKLDYFAAAATPGGLARGIAAACSGSCPTNSDTDADELLDGWEVANGFNPRDASDARLDKDNDGMPDWWEIMNGFNVLDGSDAAADTDGDGVSNLRESVRGTDPRDPASVNRTLYVDSVIGSNTFDGCWSTVRTYGRGPKTGVQQMLDDAVSGDVIEMRGSAAFPDRTLTTGGKGIILRPVGSMRF